MYLLCISWFKESKHTHRSSLVYPTLPMMYLVCISWFKESKHTHSKKQSCQHYQCCTLYVYLDSKRVSILIEAVKESKHTCQHYQCCTLYVYLDSKRVSILIEAVLPTLPMLYLVCISWFKESKHTHRSSFANITNDVPCMYILIQRE